MTTITMRNYNCKDEELPVICRFNAFSLKRDLPEFNAFSPVFNTEYVASQETKIAQVSELVAPKSETVALKTITDRLYQTMNGLIPAINNLNGYIGMAHDTMSISTSDFGLTDLRKGITKKDAESVIKNLNTINLNINKYKEPLQQQGLRDDLINKFASATSSIAGDKQKQYEITSTRKNMVQNNLNLLNDLHSQLTEILRVGKILYKPADAAKLQEYTFSELKKKVRKTAKISAAPVNTLSPSANNA
jgi:hypothetical protein